MKYTNTLDQHHHDKPYEERGKGKRDTQVEKERKERKRRWTEENGYKRMSRPRKRQNPIHSNKSINMVRAGYQAYLRRSAGAGGVLVRRSYTATEAVGFDVSLACGAQGAGAGACIARGARVRADGAFDLPIPSSLRAPITFYTISRENAIGAGRGGLEPICLVIVPLVVATKGLHTRTLKVKSAF